jgi:hypothetical protein
VLRRRLPPASPKGLAAVDAGLVRSGIELAALTLVMSVPFLRPAALLGVMLLAAACQSNPKQTVLNLDTTDPKWMSRKCIAHRKAAADYNDGERTRAVVGLADYAAPLVGTAASSLLSLGKDPQRQALNERIKRDCITPPRAQKTRSYTQSGRKVTYKPKPYTGQPRRP